MARGQRSLQSAPFVAAAVVIAAAVAAGSPAVAAESKLVSSQAFAGDQFGYSVSFDSGTLAIGAPEVDWVVNDFSGDGAVYIFERRETGEWSEVDRVDYGTCCGAFGSAVAVRGDLLLVGAPHVECFLDVPCGRGLLFERDPSTQRWERVLELNPSQYLVGFDDFGGSVALAGDSTRQLLLVGAPGGYFATGQVVVYERDPATGGILSTFQLLASDGEERDAFGRSVAGHGRLVVVGAPGDDDLGSFSGSAYVFERTGDGWEEIAKLGAPDGAASDALGASVSIHGEVVVVGAPGDGGLGHDAGAVYVFAPGAESGLYELVAELTASDGSSGDLFGSSVSIRGETLLVGAEGHDGTATDSGAAYLFARDASGSWVEVGRVAASDGQAERWLGVSVAAGEHLMVAGAPGKSTFFGGGPYVGSTYIFERHLLTLSGKCPGHVGATAQGLGSFGRGALMAARSEGASVIGSGACEGTELDLEDPRLLEVVTADGSGVGSAVMELGEEECGAYLQSVAERGCATSNVARASFPPAIPVAELAPSAPTFDFGQAVATTGDLAIVGAPSDREYGDGAGAIFVYAGEPGDPTSWTEVTKLAASDATSNASFGWSLAVSTDLLVVGAKLDDWCGDDENCGSAYLFQWDAADPSSWTELAKLTASDVALGEAAAISGDTIVLGAGAEAAYVFELDPADPSIWTQTAVLEASDGVPGDYFGSYVAVSGDTAAVGAWAADGRDGAVYVYERDPDDPAAWSETARLRGSHADSHFSVVALQGETLAVGAWGDGDLGPDSGTVHLFERDPVDPSAWVETAKLLASDGGEGDRLGYSVALTADRIVAGAYQGYSGPGAVYVFERDPDEPASWREVAKLVSSAPQIGDSFGFGAAARGETVLVGAPDHDTDGTAYVYSLEGLAVDPAAGWPTEEGRRRDD